MNRTGLLLLVLLAFVCAVTWYWYDKCIYSKIKQAQKEYLKTQHSENQQLINDNSEFDMSSVKEEFKNFIPEKVSLVEEGYYVIRKKDNQKYCSNTDNGVVCNRDLAGPDEIFYIIHLGQGKYAIRNSSTGLWCTLTTTGVYSTSPIISDYEIFNLRHLRDREYAIQNNKTKKFCTDPGNGLVCDVNSLYGNYFQTFELIKVDFENIK